mmetsp:Transcript_5102/g.10505  ORF Transcript_5102/g.10505 Transcript_5102/m.10505 type:complete len:222 (-) Transcript_5102:50-715(-)
MGDEDEATLVRLCRSQRLFERPQGHLQQAPLFDALAHGPTGDVAATRISAHADKPSIFKRTGLLFEHLMHFLLCSSKEALRIGVSKDGVSVSLSWLWRLRVGVTWARLEEARRLGLPGGTLARGLLQRGPLQASHPLPRCRRGASRLGTLLFHGHQAPFLQVEVLLQESLGHNLEEAQPAIHKASLFGAGAHLADVGCHRLLDQRGRQGHVATLDIEAARH